MLETPVTDPVWTAAQTAWGEARGEPAEGQQAVLNVIANRAKHPCWWGQDIVSVCLADRQFSCWNPEDPNREKMIALTTDDPIFAKCLELATLAVAGTLPDLTYGADSYYAVSIPAPAWISGARFTTQIGQHRFYVTRDTGV